MRESEDVSSNGMSNLCSSFVSLSISFFCSLNMSTFLWMMAHIVISWATKRAAPSTLNGATPIPFLVQNISQSVPNALFSFFFLFTHSDHHSNISNPFPICSCLDCVVNCDVGEGVERKFIKKKREQ